MFAGRTDVVGTEDGGCERVESRSDWHGLYRDHLLGRRGIGVYPITDDDRCSWGCIDLDIKPKPSAPYDTPHDAWEAAINLVNALRHLGLVGWVEQTKSGGFHVWVFCEMSIKALAMRNALLVACKMADVDPREVNPKQGYLLNGQVGNYVRLPYKGALLGSHEREVRVQENGGIPFLRWLNSASATANPLHAVTDANHLHDRPLRAKRAKTAKLDSHEIMTNGGLVAHILEHGPLEGGDRSGTLWKLACLVRDDGMPRNECVGLITQADEAWGKFHGRPDADQQLSRIVQKVYGEN